MDQGLGLLALALREMSRFVVSDASLGDTLTRIAEITTDALPSAAFAGMTMLDDNGKPTTAVFTDPRSPEIDSAQYETGDGPCLDAWRRREVVRIEDTGSDTETYERFCRSALDHGIHSTLSLPLVVDKESLGALNLYARAVAGFSDQDAELAGELASVAAVVMANSQAYWAAYQLTEQLNDAMRSRSVIEQAKGILMARSPGIDADQAFNLLKGDSQRKNVKLRVVAKRTVDERR